uniref:CHK domain-containing protein n=1 Tax=Glossina brevipalpis TaxID=37001 RepID=A0A1A9WZU8_9MUSC
MLVDMSISKLQDILSLDECLQIVRNDLDTKLIKEIKIINYEIKKADDLCGFMGEYFKLIIKAQIELLQDNGQSVKIFNYFIKSQPIFNELQRIHCESKGVFRKESGIYKNILPNLQRYAKKELFAKCYLAKEDLIVLEDLMQSGKCIRHLKSNEYNENYYKLVLQYLAELHVASMSWELRDKINIQKDFSHILFELDLTVTNDWFCTGVKSILFLAQKHPQFQYSAAQDFIKEKLYDLLENLEEFINASASTQNVFCHRDVWGENIFFQYDEKYTNEAIGCRIVDFSSARYCPPAIDVLYFLYNNLPLNAERCELLKILLDFYYNSLSGLARNMHLKLETYTRKHFDEDCQRALLPVLVQRAICEPLMKLPEGWAQKMRREESETYDYYMNVDRTEMFLRVSQLDENYEDLILKPIQEIMTYFGFKGQ